MKRRDFLSLAGRAAASTSASLAIGSWPIRFGIGPLSRSHADEQATPFVDKGFAKVWRVTDGVYATIADPSKGAACLSNGGVIAGRDAVLAVEGHFQAAGAALELEIARMVSKAPIRAAVDTHFHLDHSFGNIGYAAQKVPIIAHERVPELVNERYLRLKTRPRASALAPVQRRLEKETDSDWKQRRKADLAAMEWIVDSSQSVTFAPPTELVRAEELPKTIDLGGLTAIIEFHRGHSPTDLIIRVPERDVVYTGDLLFNNEFPVCMDADMLAWRRVLDRFFGYGKKTTFIPGHGQIANQNTVVEMAALFDDMRSHAEHMVRSGADHAEATRRYVIPKQFEKWDASFSWALEIGGAMESYYAALATGR